MNFSLCMNMLGFCSDCRIYNINQYFTSRTNIQAHKLRPLEYNANSYTDIETSQTPSYQLLVAIN